MLRLISFNMDYYWACTASDAPPLSSEKVSQFLPSHRNPADTSSLSQPSASPSTPTERSRSLTSHPMHLYSFPLYLAYALYPPLYLAGPLLSYNSFLSQLITPPTIPRRLIASYAARFVACLLTMELVLHSMYVVAIKDESRRGAWAGTTPFELSMVGFWNLIVVWLKVCVSAVQCQRHWHSLTFSCRVAATHSVALLPSVVTSRRSRPTREHDSMYGKQLLDFRLLAQLASLVQPLDRAVRLLAGLPTPPSRRMLTLRLAQVSLRSSWRSISRFPLNAGGLHFRCALARPQSSAAHLGLGHLALCVARDDCQALCSGLGGASNTLLAFSRASRWRLTMGRANSTVRNLGTVTSQRSVESSTFS